MASATGTAPRADLHTHSTASDGADAPAELVARASRRGLAMLALTDHDTTAGLAEALETGEQLGVQVIPGLELSTDVPHGELHMLGYGIDAQSSDLQRTLETLRDGSARRLDVILERLRALGIDLPESVIERTDERRSVGRPHVARALVAAGQASDIQDAFARYLGEGQPAYVPKPKVAPADAVRLIRAAGGLPVMAHPYTLPDFESWLDRLAPLGLVGLEAYYGEYDDARRAELAASAARRGLLATGGSDYHGEHFKEGRVLGAAQLPQADLQRFLAALAAR